MIDRLCRPTSVLWVADDRCLIELHRISFDQFELSAKNDGNIHREIAHICVEEIGQNTGKHVGARTGELDWEFRERAYELKISRQVQSAVVDLANDHPRRQKAEPRGSIRPV